MPETRHGADGGGGDGGAGYTPLQLSPLDAADGRALCLEAQRPMLDGTTDMIRTSTGNSQDDSVEERTFRVCCCGPTRWPVIDPNESRCLNTWDFLVAVLLITTALLSPFETAFLEPRLDLLFAFNRFIDSAFVVDMVLQFFISYPDPLRPTYTVKNPRRIVRHYLSGWFWVDFFSVLPIDIYCVITKPNDFQGYAAGGLRNLKIMRLLRLVRLLRLARFTRLMERWHTSFGFSYATLSLAKFFATVVLCCHWMACLWGGLAVHSVGPVTWLSALQEAKGGPDELYEGPLQVYCISAYWAIITLTSIGYGDITPQTGTEYAVATVCTCIMAAIWAYVIGAVCGIVSTMEPHEMNFKRTMDDLNWLMTDRAVPHDMCKKLRRYFHETREITRQRAEREIIDQMSPKLQGEFAHFMHKKWIKKVWYLKDFPQDILVFLSRRMEPAVYSPCEEVFSDRTLFIVRSGICALRGRIMVSGDIWGEDMLLSNDFLREKEACRSLSYLSVLKLHVADLVEIVSNFPEARAKLRWSQVQIAILRGVQRIAEVTRELDQKGDRKSADLNDEERLELFVGILQGRVGNAKVVDDGQDYFGVTDDPSYGTRSPLRRAEKRRSTQLRVSLSAMSAVEEERSQRDIDVLGSKMESLGKCMEDLTSKVDRLVSASLRAGSSADLGPLIVPTASFNRHRKSSSRVLLGSPHVVAKQSSQILE